MKLYCETVMVAMTLYRSTIRTGIFRLPKLLYLSQLHDLLTAGDKGKLRVERNSLLRWLHRFGSVIGCTQCVLLKGRNIELMKLSWYFVTDRKLEAFYCICITVH